MTTNTPARKTTRILLALLPVLALNSSGCGKPAVTLTGGKPVGHWVQALRSPDPRQRKEAVFKLGNVGTADPAALPALLGSLDDRDPIVRREVVLALVKLGPAAAEAVPKLVKLRESDRDPKVRGYAARAIDKLGGK